MLVTQNPLKKPVEWSRNGVFVVDDADWTSLELAVLPNLIVISVILSTIFYWAEDFGRAPKTSTSIQKQTKQNVGFAYVGLVLYPTYWIACEGRSFGKLRLKP